MLMGKEGFFQNCSLINSERGLEEYGSSAYLVDEEWFKKVEAGEIGETDIYDESEELDICYDDSLIFGEE
jgi:hypothetical protein